MIDERQFDPRAIRNGKSKPVGRPPERISVCLMFEREDPEDLVWPKNWPFPQRYDTVLGRRLRGHVAHIDFDLAAERLVIYLTR